MILGTCCSDYKIILKNYIFFYLNMIKHFSCETKIYNLILFFELERLDVLFCSQYNLKILRKGKKIPKKLNFFLFIFIETSFSS